MEDVSPMRFDYHAPPSRVLFGAGRRRETPEVARQRAHACTRSATRWFVICMRS